MYVHMLQHKSCNDVAVCDIFIYFNEVLTISNLYGIVKNSSKF